MQHGIKVAKVDDQEYQYDGAQYAHVPGSPMGRSVCDRISLASGGPVFPADQYRPYNVHKNQREVDLGNRLNERVVAHKLRIDIKRLAPIVFQQLKVANKVDH